MKPVDSELLKKYHRGLCTDEEKQAVEQWLASGGFEGALDLPDSEKAARKQQIWQTIARRAGWTEPKVVPMYRRVARYAAVACIVFAAFFGGRFSVSTANATNTVDKTPKDMLHIYGGNGAYAKMNADRYQLRFEGMLKLHNKAEQHKQIVCGEQEFTLEPHKTYFLSGSDRKAHLMTEYDFLGTYHNRILLASGFSALKLND
ncbi:MAG: hypothetical protein AAF944_24470 [Bacteroidota bacterium]